MDQKRKRHVQQELFRHGGKRKGAGRPAKGPRPSERHKRRERFRSSEPVHATLRVAPDLEKMRRRDMYKAIRWASFAVARRGCEAFRIVHYSVQDEHIHLICEAIDCVALATGIKSFAGSAAKHINAIVSKLRGELRTGQVFPDRYHSTVLKSPTMARHAMSYVLNNWRHHRKDEYAGAPLLDPYSSAVRFLGWKHRDGTDQIWRPPAEDDGAWVWLPQTWLLSEGWRRGGDISALEVPGEHTRKHTRSRAARS
jgi:REP element-mobilizing transposase RayT